MILLREYIRMLLSEGTSDEPDMTEYVDKLIDLILEALRSDLVKKEVESMAASEEWPAILDSEGKVFGDYENINNVRMILSVNDEG